MPFPPSMRRLLRLRESLERQEEMELAFAAARLRAAEASAATAHAAEQDVQAALRRELEEEVSGAELQAAQFSQQAGQQREQLLGDQLALRACERDAQRERWIERNRERKTLETLDQHQRAAERIELERKTQAALDEAFLLRRRETI